MKSPRLFLTALLSFPLIRTVMDTVTELLGMA